MKITGCKFYLVETPRETGAISGHLMIRIDTDEGIIGWGERSDLAHSHPAEFPNFDLVGCIDRGHSLHMFGDMVDTIIGMTSLQGGGHAMEGDVRYVSEERVRGAGAG